MKKLYLIAIVTMVLLQSCMVSKHPNMAFFDNPYYDYKNASFTSVNVPVWLAKPFVKNALREDGESEEVLQLVKKIKKVNVLTVENGNSEMLTDFSKYLQSNQYQDWATLHHDGQKVNVQVLQERDVINKVMLIVKSESDLVFVNVKGKFTTDDISNLINQASKNDRKSKTNRFAKK